MLSFAQSYQMVAAKQSRARLFAPEASGIAPSTTDDFGENPTRDSYPWFLRCMDADPTHAAAGVHTFVWKLLRSQPPPQLKRLPVEDREDVIAKLVQHFIEDDFRVLRRYQDRGRPFAGFVAVAANRRATSRLRRIAIEQARVEPIDPDPPNELQHDPTDAENRRIDAVEQLRRVRECLNTLPERCQILLKAAAEGRPPRAMVTLLGWPSNANQKVWETLRQCRKKLKRCVETHA